MEYVGGGVDYNSGPYNVQFDVGVTRILFNISVNDDNIVERNKRFSLNIDKFSLPDRVTISAPDQATVIIPINDSKCEVNNENFWQYLTWSDHNQSHLTSLMAF